MVSLNVSARSVRNGEAQRRRQGFAFKRVSPPAHLMTYSVPSAKSKRVTPSETTQRLASSEQSAAACESAVMPC